MRKNEAGLGGCGIHVSVGGLPIRNSEQALVRGGLWVTRGKGMSGRSACAKSPRRELGQQVPEPARSIYIVKCLLGDVFPEDFMILVELWLSSITSPSRSWSYFTIFIHWWIQFAGICFGNFTSIFRKLSFHIKITISLNEPGSVAYFTILWENL